MNRLEIVPVQADIIFKALYYVLRQEKVEVSASCEELYTFLAEHNPNDTHIHDVLDVMERLDTFIRADQGYADTIREESEEEDEDEG